MPVPVRVWYPGPKSLNKVYCLIIQNDDSFYIKKLTKFSEIQFVRIESLFTEQQKQ